MEEKQKASSMKSDYYEAVVFFNKKGILKEMRYSEFEAVLDGVVGISEFSGKEMSSCYLHISTQLNVTACVLFLIDFDNKGNADSDWNIPLQHLASNGGQGPDLGEGPIKLACKSQCSVSWHQGELWDPDKQQDYFLEIKSAIARNKLGFKKIDTELSIPTIKDVLDVQAKIAENQQIKHKSSDLVFKKQFAKLNDTYKKKMHALEDLRIKEVDQIKRVMRNEKLADKQTILSLEQKNTQQSVLNDSLSDKYKELTYKFDAQSKETESVSTKLQLIKDEYFEVIQKQNLAQKSDSEQVKLLEAEIESYRRKNEDLIGETAGITLIKEEFEIEKQQVLASFVKKLNECDLVFVAYHLGAGHITLSSDNLLEYLGDPDNFAAQKCNVTVDQYRLWVKHFERPVCEECSVPVTKIGNPQDFQEGFNDRCIRHKKV